VYNEKLKPVLTDAQSPKSKVAGAVRAVWRMRIYSADTDIVTLLKRSDLTTEERGRLYGLLATFGSYPCVAALLDAASSDEAARLALARAEPAALPTLLDELPTANGAVSPRQLAAYRAVVTIIGAHNPKEEKFWGAAPAEEKAKELERTRSAAQAVFDAWLGREGRWR
jgi:hypothetical protein